jgi:hypothetical protein
MIINLTCAPYCLKKLAERVQQENNQALLAYDARNHIRKGINGKAKPM